MQPRFDGSLMTSLAELRAIEEERIASARAGLALTWKIVLVVELLGRPNGVGFEIRTFFNYFDIAGILAYSFAFIGIVVAIESLILQPIERRVEAWRRA